MRRIHARRTAGYGGQSELKPKRILSAILVTVAAFAYGQWAHAALGGSADTITADRKALQAVHGSTTPHGGYTVVEVVSDATTVREYVSLAGVVFGIAWNGYVRPDLMQLLGIYWSEYSAARQKGVRVTGRTRQQLATDNLVVENWGHMRNLQGRAYVPSLVPIGVSFDAIK
jgi:hypothetical protein